MGVRRSANRCLHLLTDLRGIVDFYVSPDADGKSYLVECAAPSVPDRRCGRCESHALRSMACGQGA